MRNLKQIVVDALTVAKSGIDADIAQRAILISSLQAQRADLASQINTLQKLNGDDLADSQAIADKIAAQ